MKITPDEKATIVAFIKGWAINKSIPKAKEINIYPEAALKFWNSGETKKNKTCQQ